MHTNTFKNTCAYVYRNAGIPECIYKHMYILCKHTFTHTHLYTHLYTHTERHPMHAHTHTHTQRETHTHRITTCIKHV